MENKNDKNIIETFGTIKKKEILASLEEEFCNGALVLESKFPFPGYYHNTIPDQEVLDPGSIFLMTKKVHQDEDIMRLTHKIKKSFKKRFDATAGKLVVFNETRPCIRIKSLKDYADEHMCYIQIPALLKWKEFEKITVNMKRNIDDNTWDAALGTIYRKNCIVDLPGQDL